MDIKRHDRVLLIPVGENRFFIEDYTGKTIIDENVDFRFYFAHALLREDGVIQATYLGDDIELFENKTDRIVRDNGFWIVGKKTVQKGESRMIVVINGEKVLQIIEEDGEDIQRLTDDMEGW